MKRSLKKWALLALALGATTFATATVKADNPQDPSKYMTYSKDFTGYIIYRLYSPDTKVHLYTTDINEYNTLATRGWQQEGISWKLRLSKGAFTQVYRLYQPELKRHLYTKDQNEYAVLATRGWQQEGAKFASYEGGWVGTPVYRLYSPNTKEHLYTTDANEYKVLATRGWTQENIAFYGID